MADLKAAAKAALDYNQTLQEVHVTSDGTPFGLKNDAVNHAVKLEDKTISTFARGTDEAATDTTEQKASNEKQYALNVKETIKLIEGATSEEAVKQILADDERKTVNAAAEKQIAILKREALDAQAAAADAAKANRQTENPNNADTTGDQNLTGNE